jgi:hypothetical protein
MLRFVQRFVVIVRVVVAVMRMQRRRSGGVAVVGRFEPRDGHFFDYCLEPRYCVRRSPPASPFRRAYHRATKQPPTPDDDENERRRKTQTQSAPAATPAAPNNVVDGYTAMITTTAVALRTGCLRYAHEHGVSMESGHVRRDPEKMDTRIADRQLRDGRMVGPLEIGKTTIICLYSYRLFILYLRATLVGSSMPSQSPALFIHRLVVQAFYTRKRPLARDESSMCCCRWTGRSSSRGPRSEMIETP